VATGVRIEMTNEGTRTATVNSGGTSLQEPYHRRKYASSPRHMSEKIRSIFIYWAENLVEGKGRVEIAPNKWSALVGVEGKGNDEALGMAMQRRSRALNQSMGEIFFPYF
jgi:hypothetical protein